MNFNRNMKRIAVLFFAINIAIVLGEFIAHYGKQIIHTGVTATRSRFVYADWQKDSIALYKEMKRPMGKVLK